MFPLKGKLLNKVTYENPVKPEMAQWLNALAVLSEDQGSIPGHGRS